MAIDDLQKAVRRNDYPECARILEAMAPAESAIAHRWITDLRLKLDEATHVKVWDDKHTYLLSGLLGTFISKRIGRTIAEERARLSKQLPDNPVLVKSLVDVRRLSFVDEWLEWLIGRRDRYNWMDIGQPWSCARSLIRSGICRRPEYDSYIVLFMDNYEWRDRTILSMLLEDRDLLSYEVWRTFEVEGNSEGNLAKNGRAWSDAYLHLWENGLVDRDRLLEGSFSALSRDFSDHHAGWYSRFFEALKPTVNERKAREDRLRQMLGSRAPSTVSFALKSLHALNIAGVLDVPPLPASLAPAVAARAKSTALSALRLAKAAIKADPTCLTDGLTAVCEALFHADSDVQSAALDILDRHVLDPDCVLTQRIAESEPGIAPSQRNRLSKLLGKGPQAEPPAGARAQLSDVAMQSRIAALSPHWRTVCGIDDAFFAGARDAELPAALDLSEIEFPRLDPDRQVKPIADMEELLDLLTTALEVVTSVEDYERILDGVSRLCRTRPDGFDRRSAPLLRRAGQVIGEFDRPQETWYAVGPWPHGIAYLIRAWLVPKPSNVIENRKRSAYLTREEEVVRRVHSGEPLPLLSLPTHAGGWIDPQVAVERFSERLKDCMAESEPLPVKQGFWSRVSGTLRGPARVSPYGPEKVHPADRPDFIDILEAILRLAPDHRSGALAAASDLPGEIGAAFRYALGSDEPAIGPVAELWVAACRSRNPRGDDERVERRHPGLGPDAGLAARASLNETDRTVGRLPLVGFVDIEPRCPTQAPESLPTVHRHMWWREVWHAGQSIRSGADHEAHAWPGGRHSLLPPGVQAILTNIDWQTKNWGDIDYIERLLDPDFAMDQMACALLGAALCAAEPGQSSMATDVLIAGIDDGRIDFETLAGALALVLPMTPTKPARWVRPLTDAAKVSELHARAVRFALMDVLGELVERKPAEIVGLLQLLYELSVEAGGAIEPTDAREALESMGGSGKAAKLAKSLLALKASPGTTDRRRAAMVRSLEGRIARAERWQQWSDARN